MDKIQIAFFFISGFFISRLLIKTEIPQRAVSFLFEKKHIPLSKIVLYLLSTSAFLSFFIPNVITVLTLLPLLEFIIRSFNKDGVNHKMIPTMLTLAVMYGANIGGMGSLTATPANGILISFIGMNSISGAENLSFASWLLWGIPLVIIFTFIAWVILISFFKPWRMVSKSRKLSIKFEIDNKPNSIHSIILTAIYFISSFFLSLLMINNPELESEILIITGTFTLLFVMFLFIFPFRNYELTAGKTPLLKISDCFSNLPLRGFLFVGISIAAAGILYLFDLQDFIADLFNTVIPVNISVFGFLLIVALATSFSTELLSNTAIQLSLFFIILPLSALIDLPQVEALLIITLSSTCAFMSPIATGVNGLAFGGIKNVSLKSMLAIGFIMNIAGALLISMWVRFIV